MFSVHLWMLCVSFGSLLSSFTQVKETDAVVLSGAYVDLHPASNTSPENLTQVCLFKKKQQSKSFFSWNLETS